MIVTRSQRASTSASTWLESRTVLSRLLEHLLYQGIEAGRGLVQQQQLHIGRQGGDDPDLLLVALGVGTTFLRGSRSKRSSSSARRWALSPPRIRPSRSMTSPPVRFGHSVTSPGT
jgi:hypothetical protein